jgi:hypothetical protein
MNDAIRIPEVPWRDALIEFARHSALRYCTSFALNSDGTLEVVADRPIGTFSSSEAVLWRLLVSMVSGDLAAAFDRCDDLNLRLLIAAVSAPLNGSAVTR